MADADDPEGRDDTQRVEQTRRTDDAEGSGAEKRVTLFGETDAREAVRAAWTAELARVLSGLPAATVNVIVPLDALRPDGPGNGVLAVGRVTGPVGLFLSPDQVRALAGQPGSTVYRLLVDPADGRCVERSITAYRPDAAMRAQVLAADRTCRAPGCTTDGAVCQVDHVNEFGTPGGQTAETNLALLHVAHHHRKTARAWDSELAANRDITWTSLLGRIYRTRAADYRQYATLLTDAVDRVSLVPAHEGVTVLDQEVYRALSFRPAGHELHAPDDELDLTGFGAWSYVRTTHTDDAGRRRPGPSPHVEAQALTDQALTMPRPTPRPRHGEPDQGNSSNDSSDSDKGERDARALYRDEGPPPF